MRRRRRREGGGKRLDACWSSVLTSEVGGDEKEGGTEQGEGNPDSSLGLDQLAWSGGIASGGYLWQEKRVLLGILYLTEETHSPVQYQMRSLRRNITR